MVHAFVRPHMAVTATARERARERPLAVAAFLTAIGYTLVIGTFLGVVDLYPEISLETVTLLSHAIAVINTITTILLVLGWRWARRHEFEKHRLAMVGAFLLILVFLVLYLHKIGGGGTKEFVGPTLVTYGYLLMLAVHIVLSIVAVPLVLYALVLGITRSIPEVRETSHAKVGRIAAGAWILSLVLGVVTYLMLEHFYAWEYAVS